LRISLKKLLMKLKLIACEVLTREIGYCAAQSPHTLDIEFTKKDAHDNADNLRTIIQDKIHAADGQDYDAILLGIGLCGNSTAGIKSEKTKIIIPRAHDCCTIFLGSRQRFQELFQNRPSTPFTSAGYMERGTSLMHDSSDFAKGQGLQQSMEEYAAIYGEENARYLWETLHQNTEEQNKDIVYIEIPELAHLGFADKCKDWAKLENKNFVKEPGSIELIHKLLSGDWNEEEFLTVIPGEAIEPVYDWDQIIQAKL
jgi:hypothetical protein